MGRVQRAEWGRLAKAPRDHPTFALAQCTGGKAVRTQRKAGRYDKFLRLHIRVRVERIPTTDQRRRARRRPRDGRDVAPDRPPLLPTVRYALVDLYPRRVLF